MLTASSLRPARDGLRRAVLLSLFLVLGSSGALAQPTTGTLAGVVVDAEIGETLPGANVLILSLSRGDATSLDGSYQIENIPAGTYEVRYSFAGMSTQNVTGVEVRPGETTTLNIELDSSAELEEVTVTASAIIELNTEAGLLQLRSKASQVSDAISAETISQSGASDAADAVQRVTGVSVQGGQYVFVRGLGDRYANTQLNGSVLPTADPDRRAVQFDLFPSSFLDNIVTLKTFTPDKPGSFSGGLVDISTKSFPSEFSSSLSLSTGGATSAVPGGDFMVDPAQGVRPFQFGPGALALPDVIANTPREEFIRPTSLVENANGERVQARRDAAASERINALSNALTPQIAPVSGSVPVTSSFGLSLGSQVPMGNNSLGFVLGLTGDQGASYYDNGVLGRIAVQGSDEGILVDTTQNRSDIRASREATLGGIANLGYRIGSYNEVNLNTLFSHTVESEARRVPGFDNVIRENARVTDLATKYTERTLGSAQLRGEHQLPQLQNLMVEWRGSYSNTRLDQPDQRIAAILERTNDDGGSSYTPSGTPPGPQRFFRDLNETLRSGALDLTLPLHLFGRRAELKAGGLVQQTERDYSERFFFYEVDNSVALEGTSGEALEAYLAPENVGVIEAPSEPGGRYEFGHYLIEATRDQNSYEGTFDVSAAYGMMEIPLGPVRAILGARYEPSTLFVATQAFATDDTGPDSIVVVDGQEYLGTDRSYNDLLPALNLVYALSDRMNLRAAATRTLARPTFRELAPVSTYEINSGGALIGNPGLDRTLITNLDLRWEWFNQPGQILAVSAFYKNLDRPIERILVDPENGSTSYDNVDEAIVAGAEIEARQTLRTLGVLNSALGERLSLGINLTLAQSSITITERELDGRRAVDPDADDTRDLQGQSPYLVNASLSYDNAESGTAAGLFFNMAGRRLSRVGTPLPDVYESPSPQLDLTLSQTFLERFTVKASAKNVLNVPYREVYDLEQEVIPFTEYNRGTRFSLGISFNPAFGFSRPASANVPEAGASGLPAN